MQLFELFATIGLNADEFNRGIGEAKGKAEGFGASFGKVAAGVGKAVAGITAGAKAVSGAIAGLAVSSANAGNEVDKVSQSMGLSRQGMQEWQYILEQNNASLYNMTYGMRNIQTAMANVEEGGGKVGKAIKELGLDFEQIAQQSPEEAFDQIVRSFQELEPSAEKSALALDIFGRRAGLDLMPLLNSTSEEVDGLRQRAHDLGIVLGDEAVDAGARFSDALTDVRSMLRGFKMNIGADLVPALADGLEAFTDLMLGVEGAEERLGEALDNIVDSIAEKIPRLVEKGALIITKLVEGIVSAAPRLVEALMSALPGVVQAITDILPMVIEAGVQIVVAIVEGIVQALPKLVPVAIDAINAIIHALIDNIGLIMDAALQLMIGLQVGMMQALPELLKIIPDLITAIVDALIDNIDMLIDAGVELFVALIENLPAIIIALVKAIPQIFEALIRGFMSFAGAMEKAGYDLALSARDGILNAIPKIIESGKELAGRAVDSIKSFFGIQGESAGAELPRAVARGIRAETAVAVRAAADMASQIMAKATSWIDTYTKEVEALADTVPRALSNITRAAGGSGSARTDNAQTEAEKRAEIERKEFEHSKRWIEKKRFFNKLSTQDEIDAWERVQARHLEGTEERMEADRNLFTLRNRLEREGFEHSRKWIETRKFFGELSLQEEVEAWERVQARYLEGTREREEADRNLFNARNRLMQEEERIWDRKAAAEYRYQQQLERTTQSFFNSFRLFQDLNTTEEQRAATAVSARQRLIDIETRLQTVRESTSEDYERLAREETRLLQEQSAAREALREAEIAASKSQAQLFIENARQQFEEARNLSENIVSLAARGIDDTMLASKTQEQISIMAGMTERELQEIAGIWADGQALAAEMAVRELQSMREEVDAEIQELYDELNELVNTESPELGKNIIQKMIDGMLGERGALADSLSEVVSNAISQASGMLSSLTPSSQGFSASSLVPSLAASGASSYSSNLHVTIENFNGNDASEAQTFSEQVAFYANQRLRGLGK